MTPKASTPITIISVNVVAITTLRNQWVRRIVKGMTKMANIKPAAKGMRKRCPHHSATMTANVAKTVAAVLERVYGAACCVECVGVVISYFIIFEPNCLAATVSDTLTVCCTVPHTEDYFYISALCSLTHGQVCSTSLFLKYATHLAIYPWRYFWLKVKSSLLLTLFFKF
jgi:hypothetical protein